MSEQNDGPRRPQRKNPELRRQDLLFADEVYRIKGACIDVHNELGCGFLEYLYEDALRIELTKRGFSVGRQVPFQVTYDGHVIGDFRADMVIDGKIIIELKAVEQEHPIHKAQLINYLKASGLKLGLLVNFGKTRLECQRVVFTKHQS